MIYNLFKYLLNLKFCLIFRQMNRDVITIEELLSILKALGDENRLNIVMLLLRHDFCVGALSKRLDISEAAVSQHLKVLRQAGIVRGEKRGYFTHYRVESTALEKLSGHLSEMIQMSHTFHGKSCRHIGRKQALSSVEKINREASDE